MTAVAKPTGRISPEEYLEGERHSEIRHEYVDGHVYAMAGASLNHNQIAGNIFAELRQKLGGSRCRVFISDVKVKTPPQFADVYYYPDVVVSCDPADRADYYLERPCVIFEVISPETERTDRSEKPNAYRQISSVKLYVIVEQKRPLVTVLKQADVGWDTKIIEGTNAVLKVPTLKAEIPLKTIYQGLVFSRGISD